MEPTLIDSCWEIGLALEVAGIITFTPRETIICIVDMQVQRMREPKRKWQRNYKSSRNPSATKLKRVSLRSYSDLKASLVMTVISVVVPERSLGNCSFSMKPWRIARLSSSKVILLTSGD